MASSQLSTPRALALDVLPGPTQKDQVTDEGSILPRGSPHVGFLRHSPKQAVMAHFAGLRKRRDFQDNDEMTQPFMLPRKSPYVGHCRHAPPSPILRFSSLASAPMQPHLLPLYELPDALELPAASISLVGKAQKTEVSDAASDVSEAFDHLPEHVWILVLSCQIEVGRIRAIASIARGFLDLLKTESVWAKCPARVTSTMVPGLAPVLSTWLPAWRNVSKLIIPRSKQLISEVTRKAPDLPLEVAWRFDSHLHGAGVEVVNQGQTVRRIEDADEELVVLGDAPLPATRPPYFEVILEDRSAEVQPYDSLNDFGIGFTACPPATMEELGTVADEVPRSWVVDFTQVSVVLSVNNCEVAKGRNVNGIDLTEGSRVGLRVTPAGSIEVFLNGRLREHLVPPSDHQVPQGVDLFPVLDLYGCTVQLSRTDAEEP